MAEIAFLTLAAYLVWYAIQHLRNEHAAYGGFLNRPYGDPEDTDADFKYREYDETTEFEEPAKANVPVGRKPASYGSLDDQPADVIAEVARRAFGK